VFANLQHLKLYAADPEQEYVEQKCGTDLESHVIQDPLRFETSKTVSSDSGRLQDFDEMNHSSGSAGNQAESISSEKALVGKAASHRKDSIVSVAEEEALCLVLGSEGQGLSETVRRSCKQVSIHMPGDFESLNVAVAGGILLYLLMIRAPYSGDSSNAL
jgi:tRNA G18 (ribose-2'-O)-methylase SpoU